MRLTAATRGRHELSCRRTALGWGSGGGTLGTPNITQSTFTACLLCSNDLTSASLRPTPLTAGANSETSLVPVSMGELDIWVPGRGRGPQISWVPKAGEPARGRNAEGLE